MNRLSPPAIVSFLAQTTVFRGVPVEVLTKLAPFVEQQTIPAGKLLVAPGAVVTTLGFLASGRASMQLIDALSGQRSTLEDVHPGDVFGEVGLMLGAASPVVVLAEEDCEVVSIQKAHFDKLVTMVPDAMAAVAKRISARFVKVSVLGGKKAGSKSIFPEPLTGSQPRLSLAPPPTPGASLAPPRPGGTVPFAEISAYAVGPKVLEFVPTRTILEHRLLPLELRGRTLVVGMVSPFSLQARDELRRVLHTVDPEIVAIGADDFANAILRLKIDVRDQRGGAAGQSMAPRARPQYQAELKKEADKQLQVMIGDDAVVLLDRVLLEAVDRGVSDVHIEPEAGSLRIRYRVQGMLMDRKEMIPATVAAPIVARIKVLAELDITERRVPQDGRIVAMLGQREVNLRVSTMPSARGEKVVIRILDPSDVMRPLEHIFLDPRGLELVQRALASQHGALMIAGSAGSGKSSTLYSLLNARKLSRPDNNLVTIEDPVEFLVPGFSQSPINPKQGLDYPTALRAIMRQDPDVIMVGELRDATTAQMLLESALTGHLALSTMHAGSALACLQRLEHFGIGHLHIGQALNVIILQKLARRLCPSCTRDEDAAPQLVEALLARKLLFKGATAKMPRAVGCEACNMTGYRGRVAVHEIVYFDDDTRLAFEMATPTSEVLAKAALAGTFLNFAHCARLLMAKHMITPGDALSLTD